MLNSVTTRSDVFQRKHATLHCVHLFLKRFATKQCNTYCLAAIQAAEMLYVEMQRHGLYQSDYFKKVKNSNQRDILNRHIYL